MLDLDAWYADPFNYQPPPKEEPHIEWGDIFDEHYQRVEVDPFGGCVSDHDHERSWYCYLSNGNAVAKPDNMRRDAVDLIDAVRELTEVLKVKPS